MDRPEGPHIGLRRIVDGKKAGKVISRIRRRMFLVVGTDLLAAVATKQPAVAQGFPQTVSILSRALDRQIAQTPSGIEKIGGLKSLCRTGIKAAGTWATGIPLGKRDSFFEEGRLQQEGSDREPGSKTGMNQKGVLTHSAKACHLSE